MILETKQSEEEASELEEEQQVYVLRPLLATRAEKEEDWRCNSIF